MARVNEEKKPPSRRWHFIAALLADYRLARAMLIGTAIYGVLVWFDLPAFVCPWQKLTSLPCPGCGMTRSTLALMKGNFAESLQYNALTWVVLLFWIITAVGITIPARYRKVWITKIGEWEQRSRWGLWFGGILAIYTLTRWL
jgi:hypothetical protein